MNYSEIVKTETVVKKTVQTVINGNGPFCAYLSVDTHGEKNPQFVDIVIGANYSNRAASAFDKDSIKDLIDLLVDIHEAMV